jgi:hypothetical protein
MKDLSLKEIEAVSGAKFDDAVSYGFFCGTIAIILNPGTVCTGIGNTLFPFIENEFTRGVLGAVTIGAGIEFIHMGAQALDSYFYPPQPLYTIETH